MQYNPELEALLYLLEDPDINVFEEIREKIISLGIDVIPHLENTWELNEDLLVQKRVEEIVHQIQYDVLLKELEGWLSSETDDLLKGSAILCSYQFPALNFELLEAKVIHLKREIWLEFGIDSSPLKIVHAFNRVFFEQWGFKKIAEPLQMQHHWYFNYLFSSHQGQAISLATLYLILARELNLPIHLMRMPDNRIMLAYLEHEFNAAQSNYTYHGEIHFLIDPSEEGKVLTLDEIEKELPVADPAAPADFLSPMSHCHILLFQLKLIIQFYQEKEELNKVTELQQLAEMVEMKIYSLKA